MSRCQLGLPRVARSGRRRCGCASRPRSPASGRTRRRTPGTARCRVRGPSIRCGSESVRRRIRPVLEAVQPLEDVARPADRLAELAVAHEVDADLGLLPHDLGHRAAQAARRSLVVDRLAGLPGPQAADELGRADQAPHVRGEDAVRAAASCPMPHRDHSTRHPANPPASNPVVVWEIVRGCDMPQEWTKPPEDTELLDVEQPVGSDDDLDDGGYDPADDPGHASRAACRRRAIRAAGRSPVGRPPSPAGAPLGNGKVPLERMIKVAPLGAGYLVRRRRGATSRTRVGRRLHADDDRRVPQLRRTGPALQRAVQHEQHGRELEVWTRYAG